MLDCEFVPVRTDPLPQSGIHVQVRVRRLSADDKTKFRWLFSQEHR